MRASLRSVLDDLTLADRVDRARAMDHWFRGFSKVVRYKHRFEHENFWTVLQERIGHLLTRPVGRPPKKPQRKLNCSGRTWESPCPRWCIAMIAAP